MGTFVVKLSHDLPPKIYTLRLDAWFSVTFMIKHSYITHLECQSLHSDSKPCLECVVKEALVLNVKYYDIKNQLFREEVGRSFLVFFWRICWIFFIKVPNNSDVLGESMITIKISWLSISKCNKNYSWNLFLYIPT